MARTGVSATRDSALKRVSFVPVVTKTCIPVLPNKG